jgi:hypothetical protein
MLLRGRKCPMNTCTNNSKNDDNNECCQQQQQEISIPPPIRPPSALITIWKAALKMMIMTVWPLDLVCTSRDLAVVIAVVLPIVVVIVPIEVDLDSKSRRHLAVQAHLH